MMTKSEAEHIVAELKDNLKQKDLIKARIVLSHLTEVDDDIRRRMLYELHCQDTSFVLRLLSCALADTPSLTEHCPEIRQMLFCKVLEKPECIIELLRTSGPSETLLLVEMSGEMRLDEAAPQLLQMLDGATDDDLIYAILSAVGSIGNPQATNAVSEFLYSGKRMLVIAAIRALAQIATSTAIERLAERMGTDNELDMMILDAFAEIQDRLSMDKLNMAIRSYHANLRNYAKEKMIQVGGKAVPVLTENLNQDDPDLLIHSLNVLGDIGDVSAVPMIRKLLHEQPEDANVRFAGYESLGRLPQTKGLFTLAGGLSDPVEHVRVAAVRAIDRNYNDILAAAVRNVFTAELLEERHLVTTIITAQAESVFFGLMDVSDFRAQAMDYLINKAHKDVQIFYANLLAKNGYKSEAEQIGRGQRKMKKPSRPTVCAVDDSRMILSIYKSTLHGLDYEPMLFEFPASAIEWIGENKPDVLITDLNMPEMDGIELTRRVRQRYREDELPIMMVTTQNDLQDMEAARAAGVNKVLLKPFTAESLGGAIRALFDASKG